jgi:hypothetical protein
MTSALATKPYIDTSLERSLRYPRGRGCKMAKQYQMFFDELEKMPEELAEDLLSQAKFYIRTRGWQQQL